MIPKIIPALDAYPTAAIVTADDDYWPTWLEALGANDSQVAAMVDAYGFPPRRSPLGDDGVAERVGGMEPVASMAAP